ncbi:DUF2599 domain-containing protein [Nocardia puris]|uniref:Uncharacterized protein DUF2599 n=1 Tax=Nocardia puris TaxID=208602 RepID=A0A366DX67_9NOCA|nr:DUF2599 domain-containing protein [Nocardia puris]RBO93884.1 uncharacterized protein DUF2599 [Nocardia puris]
MSRLVRSERTARMAAALGGALILAGVAGCGTGDENAAAPSTTVTTTTAPTATAPTESATPVAAQPTVDPYAGVPLIEGVEWTDGVDGARLMVYPSQAGRRTTYPGSDERAWQEVLVLSPRASTPGMRDQFICHWDWARLAQPNKPSWNLEPWRPDVGYAATVQAACNPGGPER